MAEEDTVKQQVRRVLAVAVPSAIVVWLWYRASRPRAVPLPSGLDSASRRDRLAADCYQLADHSSLWWIGQQDGNPPLNVATLAAAAGDYLAGYHRRGRRRLPEWHKSARSSGQGQCVEVGFRPGAVVVRNSKDPDGPTLLFTSTEWDAFVGGVKDGEFDRR